MKKILALDLATATGWSYFDGERRFAGVQSFKNKFGESYGMLFLKFVGWMEEIRKSGFCPDILIYEQGHQRGRAATQIIIGLISHTLAFAAKHGIETVPVASTTLKKFGTGKGNAGKPEMIQAALEKGLRDLPEFKDATTADDNICDAFLLALYGHEKFNQ